jgi:hypothetical protein
MIHLSQSTPIAAESGTYSPAPAGPGYRCSRPLPSPFVIGEAIRHDTSRIASSKTVLSELNVKTFAMRQSSIVSEYPNVRLAPFRMASPAELSTEPGPTRLRALHPRAHRPSALQRSASALPSFCFPAVALFGSRDRARSRWDSTTDLTRRVAPLHPHSTEHASHSFTHISVLRGLRRPAQVHNRQAGPLAASHQPLPLALADRSTSSQRIFKATFKSRNSMGLRPTGC